MQTDYIQELTKVCLPAIQRRGTLHKPRRLRSVLGPRLFVLYMADLADVVSAQDVKHHAYADDTQLYLRCRAQEATTAAHRLEVCTTDVQRWMEANRLKLNADKTELL